MADIFEKLFESDYFIYILLGAIVLLIILFFVVLFSGKKPKVEKVEEEKKENETSPISQPIILEPVASVVTDPVIKEEVPVVNESEVKNEEPVTPSFANISVTPVTDKTIEFKPENLNQISDEYNNVEDMIPSSKNVIEDVKSTINFEPFPSREEVHHTEETPATKINLNNQFSSVYINSEPVVKKEESVISQPVETSKLRIDDDEPIFKVIDEDEDIPKLK